MHGCVDLASVVARICLLNDFIEDGLRERWELPIELEMISDVYRLDGSQDDEKVRFEDLALLLIIELADKHIEIVPLVIRVLQEAQIFQDYGKIDL